MPKILLIEDDISVCKLLEKFLTKKEYDVTIAFSAAEARLSIKKDSFDLILRGDNISSTLYNCARNASQTLPFVEFVIRNFMAW